MRFPQRGRGNRVGNAPLLPGDQAGIGKQNSAAMIEYLYGDDVLAERLPPTSLRWGWGRYAFCGDVTKGEADGD